MRRLAQGHLVTRAGGAGDQASNLLVISLPAVLPELLPLPTASHMQNRPKARKHTPPQQWHSPGGLSWMMHRHTVPLHTTPQENTGWD